MSNSKLILRKIRKNFDWKSYVEANLGVKYAPNGELRVNCVSCADSKYKLYVNPDKRVWRCFKCDFSSRNYDVFDFVALCEGITRAKAQMRLAIEYQDVTPLDLDEEVVDQEALASPQVPRSIKTIPSLPSAAKLLTEPVNTENGPFWSYLHERGLTTEEVLACKTHYVPSINADVLDSKGIYRGNLGRRVLWPVYGGNHSLVSWLSRTINKNYDRGDKYLNCPESEMSRTLWPYIKPHGPSVILVEGLLDCLSVRRVGKPVSAYATFGKHLSADQLLLLKSYGVTSITLFWDKRDAKREMLKAIEDLRIHFPNVFVLWLKDWPKALDAGDCLAKSDGTDIIKKALIGTVNVNTMDFARWTIAF